MRFRNFVTIVLAAVLFTMGSTPTVWSKNKFEKEVDKESAGVKLVREVQRGDYDLVTTAELKSWLEAGKDMRIIDTMPYEDSYKKHHVPGAKQFLFPISDMASWNTQETDGRTQSDYIELLGSDKARPVVVYCGFVKCTRSHNGAVWARKLGYTNVYRYAGGIFAWKGAGYEVEKIK